MKQCEFHCIDSQLPVDDEIDAVYLEDDGAGCEYLPLLIPTRFTLCPCAPEYAFNPDITGVTV